MARVPTLRSVTSSTPLTQPNKDAQLAEPTAAPGRIALVGSGEYLPVMQPIEAWLLEDQPRRYVQIATAAVPDGDATLRRWHELGAQAAQRLDAEQVVIDIRTRDDADDPNHYEAINGAGLIYLSGGKPQFLSNTLRGTRTWDVIWKNWRAGASVAGCSAGAMALCGYVPDFRHPKRGGTDGLGLVPDLRVIPHFDKFAAHLPDLVLRPLVTDGAMTVGIDENTALVADSSAESMWEFRGRGEGSVWQLADDRRHRINGAVELRVG
ncbi:MAG: hypothetical protein RJB01_835 [Actinomycetota bacterium]